MALPRYSGGGWLRAGARLAGCRWCGGPIVERGRRTFCSQACVDQHCCRSSAAGAARVVWKRDHGVCAGCGLDCEALRLELFHLRWSSVEQWQQRGRELGLLVRRRGGTTERWVREMRFWDVDHIVPVVAGGGSCGPENLRTMCWRCHRRETAELARKRAEERTDRR